MTRGRTDDTITDSVARGVRLLDERRPGWANQIDLNMFDIGSPCKCTLGQLFSYDAESNPGRWMDGYDAGRGLLLGYSEKNAEFYGFTLPCVDTDGIKVRDGEALNAEWVRVITQRQSGGAA